MRARTVCRGIRAAQAASDDIVRRELVDFVLANWMVYEEKDIPGFSDQVASVIGPEGKMFYAETWMHVTQTKFEEVVGFARSAGLQVGATPQVRFSRVALLVQSR